MNTNDLRRAPARTYRLIAAAIALLPAFANAANITWVGGNGTWNDGPGNSINWNPIDEPDSGDVAIFSTNHLITLGTNRLPPWIGPIPPTAKIVPSAIASRSAGNAQMTSMAREMTASTQPRK